MAMEQFMEYATKNPKSYDFFADGRKIFSVQAHYSNWVDLGSTMMKQVNDHLISSGREKIESGKEVVFDRLIEGSILSELLRSLYIKRYLKLTLNNNGLKIKDGQVISWEDISRPTDNDSLPNFTIDCGGKKISFRRTDSVNGLVAAELIEAMREK